MTLDSLTDEVDTRNGLHASGLCKAFAGVQALDDVSLTLPFGQVTALMGENGAGKSTLLKILDGDYQPDRGEVLIDGTPSVFANPFDARRAGLRRSIQHSGLGGRPAG